MSERPAYYTNCCNCGGIVDMREIEDGGDKDGAEVKDGQWVCSMDCWDTIVPDGVMINVYEVELPK